ncbi:hypothetical protein ABK040_001194 [Willaertia magna]
MIELESVKEQPKKKENNTSSKLQISTTANTTTTSPNTPMSSGSNTRLINPFTSKPLINNNHSINNNNYNYYRAKNKGKDQQQVEDWYLFENNNRNNYLKFICSLRVSTLILLTLTFTIMLMIFVVIISSIFATSFSDLEKKDVSNTSKRIIKSLKDQMDSIYNILYAFAGWDDAYYSVYNVLYSGSEDDFNVFNNFIDVNLAPDVMQGVNLDIAIVYLLNGTELTYKTSPNIKPILPSFLKQFPYLNHVSHYQNALFKVAGILYDNEIANQLLIWVISPITRANPTSQSDFQSYFFFGKYISMNLMNDIADSVQCCISFHVLQDLNDKISNNWRNNVKNINGTYPDINSRVWSNNDVIGYDVLSNVELEKRFCGTLDEKLKNGSIITEQRYSSYHLVTDINNNNLFIVRTDIPRSVYFVGLQSLLLAIFLLFGVCLLSTCIVIFFIERRVLSRISKLSNRIQQIAFSNDSKQRIVGKEYQAYDELGNVVKNINFMLSALDNLLEQSKEQEVIKKLFQKIAQVEESTKNIMNAIKDIVLTVNLDGRILFANSSFYDHFNYTTLDIEGLHNVTIIDLFPELTNNLTYLSNSKLNEVYNNKSTSSSSSNNNNNNNGINNVELIGKILQYLTNDEFHLLKAAPSKKKNEFIEYECMFTKCKVVLQNNEQSKVYVVVARKRSNRNSLNSTSTSNLNSISEEEEDHEMNEILTEFDKILLDEKEREKFKEYCKQEKSEENILFIEQVMFYKQLKEPYERMIKQEYIFNNFLLNNSLNISSEMLNKELMRIKNGLGQVDLFDQLLQFVEITVCKDTFMRYKQQQHDLMYL